MATKKNQHFVPKHYLRRFSYDGKRICLVNLRSGVCVTEAGLKGQCASDYFYSDVPDVEDWVGELENHAESLFRAIEERRELPPDPGSQRDILFTMGIMHSRTRRKVNLGWELPQAMLKESLSRSLARTGEPIPPEILESVQLVDKAAALRAYLISLQCSPLLVDLGLKLLVPADGCFFVSSDHPVVLMNQAFQDVVPERAPGGFASAGIQLFLPLSPRLLLLGYDRRYYRVGKASETTVRIQRAEDCALINALQVLNAEENIYFNEAKAAPTLKQFAALHQGIRKKVSTSSRVRRFLQTDDGQALLMSSKSLSIRPPGVWSFCKVLRRPTAEDFRRPRNPEFCRIHAEFREDPNGAGSGKSFYRWVEEQKAKGRRIAF